MRKLADEVRAEEGRALARLGDGGWDPVVRAGARPGGLTMSSSTRRRRSCAWLGSTPSAAWVCAVPSDRSGALVPDFARRLAEALDLPYADALARTGERPPQREMANSAQQVANVRGAFAVIGPAPGRPLPARRRPALQWLDARHARRSAAPPRRPGRLSAGARHGVLSAGPRRVVRDDPRGRAVVVEVDLGEAGRTVQRLVGWAVEPGSTIVISLPGMTWPTRERTPSSKSPANSSA